MLTNQNHRLQKLWWSNVTRIKRIASVWVRARFSHEHSVSIICYRYNPFWWESICQERCQDARPRYCVHVPWFSCLFGITDSHRLSNTGPIHTNLEIFETAYLFIRIRVDGALARGRGFKWQGWSNGGKNQYPKNPGPKFNPQKIPCRISEP